MSIIKVQGITEVENHFATSNVIIDLEKYKLSMLNHQVKDFWKT